MQPIIELNELSVKFGAREILKKFSIALFGRVIGLLGPNDAGKSTLNHTLLGFYPASSGTARIFGHDICGVKRTKFASWSVTCLKTTH